jgi:transcriptional regulator with XRE-family HTH domain
MNTTSLLFKTPNEISHEIADNVRSRRKEGKLTQKQLSTKAGVSLGSLKRFETSGEISLNSLLKLAIVLGCENDFLSLFAKKQYRSIQEIIDEEI